MNINDIRHAQGWTFLQLVYAKDALDRLQEGATIGSIHILAAELSLGACGGPEADAVTHIMKLWDSGPFAKILRAPDVYLREAWSCGKHH